jgi:biotin operon repressor
MNRTDRLLAIILELQAKHHVRAEDLAQTFEVSKRTIYRDIDALGESGVPIVAMPGLGYSLIEGYFLPPLAFTSDEAIMLLLGADFVARNFDAQYRQATQLASHTMMAVLSEAHRREVEYLQRCIVPETIENYSRVSKFVGDVPPTGALRKQFRRFAPLRPLWETTHVRRCFSIVLLLTFSPCSATPVRPR